MMRYMKNKYMLEISSYRSLLFAGQRFWIISCEP